MADPAATPSAPNLGAAWSQEPPGGPAGQADAQGQQPKKTAPEPAPTPKQPEAPEPELVGDRAVLRRVITARPDQVVTILAERRPGSSDLFVLSVDRCPER